MRPTSAYQRANRLFALGCVVLAGAVPGLLFAPVFGLGELAPSIAVVLVACFAVAAVCGRFTALSPWRPVLALTVGLLGLVEVELAGTTLAGLPTTATVRALVSGVTRSWQLTLQSTWPVRPEAQLLLFVPLAVLFATVLATELLRWPAVALLPSLAVLGLSQVFTAAAPPVATAAALAYATAAGGVLASSESISDIPSRATRSVRRGGAAVLFLAPTVVAGVAAAVAVTAVDQGRQPPYSVHHERFAPIPPAPEVNPLDEVAARLSHPEVPVFSYTSRDQVDRWRLVVLDDFNGVGWSTGRRFQRLGARLAVPAAVTVPTTLHSARVTVDAGEPWVPSQAMPASVTGAAPLVDPDSGMLLVPGPAAAGGPVSYDLTWHEPDVDPGLLAGAGLDSTAVTPGDLGVIPPGISELARTATAGLRPSFETALTLEHYLSQNYRVATGTDLPTGNGWPQLRDFLLTTKRGTSEQFAAAYVALARIVGIPARLAVGFRAPAPSADGHVVVRDGDVLAWPEVAVTGVGWVPLDPTGPASGSGQAPPGLARVTAQARAGLPPPPALVDPPLPVGGSGGRSPGFTPPVTQIVIGLLALLVLLVAGVPLSRVIRTGRRKRRTGTAGVVAAWEEARDLLRAHGVHFTPGTTARDLARAVGSTMDSAVVEGLESLAYQVDLALWSGSGAAGDLSARAWAATRTVRSGLAHRPVRARLRAWFDPRSLVLPKVVPWGPAVR